jgi:glycosyltransferase involved in cell wall biosynthesis
MKARVLILLNKDEPALTETFIAAHIAHFNAITLNWYAFSRQSGAKNRISRMLFPAVQPQIALLKRFKQYLKQHEIGVVMAEYGMVGADAAEICAMAGVPLVVHFHGHDAHRNRIVDAYRDRYKTMFTQVKAIVVVSETMKQALRALGAPLEKLHLNVYGTAIPELDFTNALPQPPVFFSAGRFVPKKAPYLVALAFANIAKDFPEARLVMAGDGELLEVCKRIAQAQSIDQRVQFLGAVSHDEVKRFLTNSLAFVQHSVTADDGDMEGTPNTILEAGAHGVPVIATRHAGIQDVVIHGQTGLLCAEGDVNSMAEHMRLLLSDHLKAAEMGKQAAKHIAEHYRKEVSLKKLEHVLWS